MGFLGPRFVSSVFFSNPAGHLGRVQQQAELGIWVRQEQLEWGAFRGQAAGRARGVTGFKPHSASEQGKQPQLSASNQTDMPWI